MFWSRKLNDTLLEYKFVNKFVDISLWVSKANEVPDNGHV